MCGLFMKKLTVDTSAEGIRGLASTLDQNNIRYEIRTTRTRGSVGTAMDAHYYAKGNLPMYKGASQPAVIYSIYVDRKKYYQATKLIHGK